MVASPAQQKWVERVLGVKVAQADVSSSMRLTSIWTDAKETVDASLAGLCEAVRGFDHPLAVMLADRGLAGFTGKLATPLMAALMEHDARPTPAQADMARKRAQAMKDFLTADRTIALIEQNPFGLPVAIRGPFLAALSQITLALSQ